MGGHSFTVASLGWSVWLPHIMEEALWKQRLLGVLGLRFRCYSIAFLQNSIGSSLILGTTDIFFPIWSPAPLEVIAHAQVGQAADFLHLQSWQCMSAPSCPCFLQPAGEKHSVSKVRACLQVACGTSLLSNTSSMFDLKGFESIWGYC